jgi:hypothetical protein
VQNGTFLFRGDDYYKGGNIGVPISGDVDAVDIIEHLQQNKTGNPFVSFSTKRAKKISNGTRGARFFGNKILKVSTDDLDKLVKSCAIRVTTAFDAYDIISAHPKKQIRIQAGNIKSNMQRNNELLIQGQIPSSIIQR